MRRHGDSQRGPGRVAGESAAPRDDTTTPSQFAAARAQSTSPSPGNAETSTPTTTSGEAVVPVSLAEDSCLSGSTYLSKSTLYVRFRLSELLPHHKLSDLVPDKHAASAVPHCPQRYGPCHSPERHGHSGIRAAI